MKDKLNISLTHNFGGSGAHLIQVPTGLFLVKMLIVGNFARSKNFSQTHNFRWSGGDLIKVATGLFLVKMLIVGQFAWSTKILMICIALRF